MRADAAAPPAPRRAAGPAQKAGHGFDIRSIAQRPWWPAAKRVLTGLFFLLVLGLLLVQARSVEWSAVLATMRAYPARSLLYAAGLATFSYAAYCTYDLIARRYVAHALPAAQVARIGFIVYAFNLTLGAWIGGVALRYRLYGRLGLGIDTTTRIVGLGILTNWLGYFFVAGAVFMLQPLVLPPDWQLGSGGLRLLGAVLMLLALGYVGTCFVAKQRVFKLRGHEVELPVGPLALAQLLVASLNWMLVAGIVHVLLQGKVDYAATLSVLLMAAFAGIIARVPAGLGVMEGVFVALLSHRVAQDELIAALLAYRAVYQLAPLALAAALLMLVERTSAFAPSRPAD